MRPGKIRVFDGLRITTEHMEHLQGSLQSAVQDLREALGLGKVYQGFEAVVESDHLVKVQPGLAFDLAKNRIVSDEPITIEVTFEQQQDTQYVCIKYARVEGGQVEGRPTLIWDSCGVELHPNLPEPKDNLIPIAKLMRSATDRFEVVSLIGDSPDDETHHEESVGDTTTAASPQPSASPGGLLSENPPARPGAWKLCVRQGVVRLASDSGNGKQASTPLVGAIKTAGAGNSANADTLCISRVEATVPLDFPVSSLTCMSLITIVFDLSPASAAATPATAPEATTHTTLRSQAAAHGEATCVGDGLSQFSLSTIRTCPALSANCSAGEISELIDDGVAHWSLDALGLPPTDTSLRAIWEIAQYLHLIVRVDRVNGNGFTIVCILQWKGGTSADLIQQIESQRLTYTWETRLAWKTLGSYNHRPS